MRMEMMVTIVPGVNDGDGRARLMVMLMVVPDVNNGNGRARLMVMVVPDWKCGVCVRRSYGRARLEVWYLRETIVWPCPAGNVVPPSSATLL